MLLVVATTQRQPVLGALPAGAPAGAEVVLGLAVALLILPVALPVGRRVAVLLAAGRRVDVGVGGSGAQRLGYPPLAHRAHPGPLGVQVGLPLAVGQPLSEP
jgi:hypothetical protein